MYIRMNGGRDRGHVKDLPYPDAQEMLRLGQALPVNFDEPDALGFRELAAPALPATPELTARDDRPAPRSVREEATAVTPKPHVPFEVTLHRKADGKKAR
jgi:hypothetical protein